MADLLIRQGTQWVNVCDKDTHFRNVETGQWIKFKSGSQVRLPSGTWLPINCSGPCGETVSLRGGSINYPTPHEVSLDFGFSTGTVKIDCYSYTAPDKFEIWWNGSLRDTTGYIGGNEGFNDLESKVGEALSGLGFKQLTFNKTLANPNEATIKIYGPYSGTVWDFKSYCPGISSPIAGYIILNYSSSGLNVQTTMPGQDTSERIWYTIGAGQELYNQQIKPGLNSFRLGPLARNTKARIETYGSTVSALAGQYLTLSNVNIPSGGLAILTIENN